MTSLTYKPRKTRHQEPPRIVIDPTIQTQAIYNQIRENEARHSQQRSLHPQDDPPDLLHPRGRAPSMSRSPTTESHISGSLSPASTADQLESCSAAGAEASPATARRPRGRRAGPLKLDKRFKTAIKRKLGFVCDQCKQKKVACGHYDLSKFEESYQATRANQAETPASVTRGALPAQISRVSPAPSDLFGLDHGGGAFPNPFPPLSDDFLDLSEFSQRPNTRQQNLQDLVTSFDVDSLRLGTGTLETSFGRSYTPLFDTSVPTGAIPQPPFPIGSEMPGFAQRWKCEYTSSTSSVSSTAPEGCSWTGPLQDLERHFASEHHAFQNEEIWCQCVSCASLSLGADPPRQCAQENCYGGQWRRWCYGHHVVESTDASTPALTQSGESDGGYSYDHRNSGAFGGPGNSMGPWPGYGANGGGAGGGSGGTNTGIYFQNADGGGKNCSLLHQPAPLGTSAGILTRLPAQPDKDSVECWSGRVNMERPRSSLCPLRSRPCCKPRFRCPTHVRFICVAVGCMLTMVTVGADIARLHKGDRARQDVEVMAVSRLSTIFLLGGFAMTWLLKRWFADHNKTRTCSRTGVYRATKVHSPSHDPGGSIVVTTYHGPGERPGVVRANNTAGAFSEWNHHDVSGEVISMLCLGRLVTE